MTVQLNIYGGVECGVGGDHGRELLELTPAREEGPCATLDGDLGDPRGIFELRTRPASPADRLQDLRAHRIPAQVG